MKKLFTIFFAILLLAVFVKADEIDTTIAQYDSSTETAETAVLTELETESAITEEQVASELSMPDEVLTEYQEVSKTIGPKQYILNRQLKHRIKIVLLTSDVILRHLEGKNTSELIAIQDKIKEIDSSIDPKTLTKATYDENIALLKGYIREFKIKAAVLTSEQEKQQIQEEVQAEVEETIDDTNAKLAGLHNRMQFARALRVVREDALRFRQDNEKLLMLKERMQALHELRQQYLQGNVTKEVIAELKSQWRERLRTYREEQKNARELIRKARIYKNAIEQNISRERFNELASELKDINPEQIRDRVREFKEARLNNNVNNQQPGNEPKQDETGNQGQNRGGY